MVHSKEEDLFYACMNFCETYFHFICTDNACYNIKNHIPYERDQAETMMRFEKERFWHNFDRLKKMVDDIDAERRKYNKGSDLNDK